MLDPFTITTYQDVGYKSTNSASALRTNTPIVDVPLNIQVYNSEFIRDSNSFDLGQMLSYEPGVYQPFPDRGGDRFTIRGFPGSASQFVNGMQVISGGQGGGQSLVNIDRVEVLKGPAAVLYGAGGTGGSINRELKRPLFDPMTQLRFVYGFNADNPRDIRRVELDTTRAINSADSKWGRVAYRFNAAWEDSGHFKVDSHIRENTYAPTLQWRIGRKTRITADFIYNKVELTPTWGLPVRPNGIYGLPLANGTVREIPTSTNTSADFDNRETINLIYQLELTHQFNDNISFRSQTIYQDQQQEIFETFPTTTFPVVTTDDVYVRRRIRNLSSGTLNGQNREELVVNVDTGPVRHNLLAGFAFAQDYTDLRIHQYDPGRPGGGDELSDFQDWQLVSVFNPNVNGPYGRNNLPATLPTLPLNTSTTVDNISRAYYINDLLSMFDSRLFLSLGYRHQEFEQDNTNRRTNTRTMREDSADTRSIGLVWHATRAKNLTFYANSNDTFEPVFTTSADGRDLPPITGEQIELGAKWDLWDGRLSGTFSWFDIKRENVPQAVPDQPGVFAPRPAEQGKGWEISVNAALTKNWQVYAGYIDLTARNQLTGARSILVPENSASFFTRYQFSEGAIKNTYVTFGGVLKGDMLSDFNASFPGTQFVVEGKWRYDASVGKRFKWLGIDHDIILSAQNLLNEDRIIGQASNFFFESRDLRVVRLEWRSQF